MIERPLCPSCQKARLLIYAHPTLDSRALCPACAATYTITKSAMEYLKGGEKGGDQSMVERLIASMRNP